MNPNFYSPIEVLLPYQRAWLADTARFKIGCWARQCGKSFAVAAEAAISCLTTPNVTWLVVSSGERQAVEFMTKVRKWALAAKVPIEAYAEDRVTAQALMKSAAVCWPNGSRVIAIPANPETARGYSANVILDEFAFLEDPEGIWRAVYPAISRPSLPEKKLRVVSSPNGRGNRFFELWDAENSTFSKHRVTIEQAVADGLKVDLEELRAGLQDPDGWAQEYLCEFMDSSATLLSYELIQSCEEPDATVIAPDDYWAREAAGTERVVLGIDFGRKHDRTVCCALALLPNKVAVVREILVLKNMPTPMQEEILRPRVALARRTCIDATGAGLGLGEYLAHRHGEWSPERHLTGRVQLCHATQDLNLQIYPALKAAFEHRALLVPADRDLREDLHAMERVCTPQGGISYRARRTDDGHSDRTAALALALRISKTVGYSFGYQRIESWKTRLIRRCDWAAL